MKTFLYILSGIPKQIQKLANGAARKSPRLQCRKRPSIKSIQGRLRHYNPGVLARSIGQLLSLFGYIVITCFAHADDDDFQDEPSHWQGYTHSSYDERWSPDIQAQTDSQPWHALNRWRGTDDTLQDEHK